MLGKLPRRLRAVFIWLGWGLAQLLGAARGCSEDVVVQRGLLMCCLMRLEAGLKQARSYYIIIACWQGIAFFFFLDLKLLARVY